MVHRTVEFDSEGPRHGGPFIAESNLHIKRQDLTP
jgi:hypothetical protein